MNNVVLIIGNHPLGAYLTKQCQLRGDEVAYWATYDKATLEIIDDYKELFLMADYEKNALEADNEVMGILELIASSNEPVHHNGKKLLCHLLLRNQSLLHLIRLEGFRDEIEQKLEVYPFTMEDQWGQSIALGLDREPITLRSEKTIHLVIFGMSQTAELVALNAAHVCHYPNYIKKGHSLRTRITVINENAFEKSDRWIQKYRHLFDNCYYRFVDPKRQPAITDTYSPIFNNREDFVDIEWEFVSALPHDMLVRNKIVRWSSSSSQLLTIVFAYEQTERGLNYALNLPDEIISYGIPVYVYMRDDQAFRQIKHSDKTTDIRPFGMVNQGYDVSLPLVKMAKAVNYIYSQCRIMKVKDGTWKMEYAVEVNAEERERLWSELPFNKRMSSYYNAMTIGVKMRSLGFKDDDWEKFYDLTQEEIEVLAQVEHNRWNVEELILGWRPCDEQEQREVETDVLKKEELKKRKIHYDLRAYNDLRPDDSGKPVQIYDRCLSACIPLIAKESKGGTQ